MNIDGYIVHTTQDYIDFTFDVRVMRLPAKAPPVKRPVHDPYYPQVSYGMEKTFDKGMQFLGIDKSQDKGTPRPAWAASPVQSRATIDKTMGTALKGHRRDSPTVTVTVQDWLSDARSRPNSIEPGTRLSYSAPGYEGAGENPGEVALSQCVADMIELEPDSPREGQQIDHWVVVL
jgi:hypothetical protein